MEPNREALSFSAGLDFSSRGVVDAHASIKVKRADRVAIFRYTYDRRFKAEGFRDYPYHVHRSSLKRGTSDP